MLNNEIIKSEVWPEGVFINKFYFKNNKQNFPVNQANALIT